MGFRSILGTRMLRVVLAPMLAASVGLGTLFAQRIVTHDAAPFLEQVFPAAVAFSPHQGIPLHYKAYGVDPRSHPSPPAIGYVFWTTDVVPQERGYHSAIHLLVGLNLKAVLTGVLVDFNSEPYGYFSIDPPAFAAQFAGKSIRAPFRVGEDVDGVARATITVTSATRAIRDSARAIARQFLDPAAVKE